jgi:hypothetical protein
MQRLMLSVLLAVSLVGLVKAQEAAADKTEEVRKEIMQIEQEKGAGLRKSVDATVDWFERVNAPDMVYWYQDHNGLHLVTRDEVVAQFRSGERKVFGNTYSDYRLRVYGNGNAAVLTYRTSQNMEMSGKPSTRQSWSTDVYAKDNGVWRRVVHLSTFGPTP